MIKFSPYGMYNFKKIEKKWQAKWEKDRLYSATFPSRKKKWYSLIEFPFPSGDGLHTGHIRSYTAMDIISRKRRMEGFNVLYPIGWDAFGLPTENYAIKTGVHPEKVTKKNTDNFRRQLKSMGLSFDWDREVNTSSPNYYKWTQWIFLKFFKRGLAYKANMPINWCPKDKIGLANEEAVGGFCERCGTKTEKRNKEQWMLKITAYADKLLEGLRDIDYREDIKIQQTNWIGKSEGAEISFDIHPAALHDPKKAIERKLVIKTVKVFTTRPDTLFGATYIVLAPEHKLIDDLAEDIKNLEQVHAYINKAKTKSEIERIAENGEKTGVKVEGIKAVHPVTREELPVYAAEYVLLNYGTGAVMAVPAHDQRDFEFAKKYNLPIRTVINLHATRDDAKHIKEFKPKRKIVAVVENDKGELLTLNWGPRLGGRLFIGGTVEEGESPEQTASREIAEETGFYDLEHLATSEETFRYRYFAYSKNHAVEADTQFLHFRLRSNKRRTQRLEQTEKDNFKVEWVRVEKADAEITENLHRYGLEKFVKGKVYTGAGFLFRSGRFDEMDSEKAKREIVKFVQGEWVTKYKLRDWVFSRQRYWGEPIPIIHCSTCGYVPVPEKDLPVKLPKVKDFRPGENGESPLASLTSWVKTKCPQCKGPAQRETDVMPNWAGSSWYYLAYIMQGISNFQFPMSKYGKAIKYWMPVDWYNGGMEHATLHLLYSRFWNLFLYDEGFVPVKEPYKKRTAHGMILGEGGVKMSKSKGNVVNPDDIIKIYGADSLRLYEMFMGPFDQAIAWDSKSIEGVSRFLGRVWNFTQEKTISSKSSDDKIDSLINRTIKKVSEDIETMSFNTAISTLMIFINEAKDRELSLNAWERFLKILAPFAPHIAEELWATLGHKKSIHLEAWPRYDEKAIQEKVFELVIQINGKLRGKIVAEHGISETQATELALKDESIAAHIKSGIKKIVFVPNRLINFVV